MSSGLLHLIPRGRPRCREEHPGLATSSRHWWLAASLQLLCALRVLRVSDCHLKFLS